MRRPGYPKTATVNLPGDEEIEVIVEDFHPYEPSAYCTDPGFDAFVPAEDPARNDPPLAEFYLTLAGEVYDGLNNLIPGATHSLTHPEA